ncbi:hypothetical protein [Acinetobacter sp. CE-15]|uniref:hypothetical protein n=1 Tax=Acinetobacter sp. CE-15 TaxID=3425693 RepID=UPI003DA20A65
MASYLELNNDITQVIDDSFFNLAFIRKERHYFIKTSGPGIYGWMGYDIDVSGIDNPVVAFSSVCGCCYYNMSATTIRVMATGANQQNIPNARDKLNNEANYVDIYIFGRPLDNTPNIGFKAWDANGKLVFDANHRYMQPQQMYQETGNYTPITQGGKYVNSKTISLPPGRKYAAYPLNRIYYVSAEWLSNGWESWYQGDVYSSVTAIEAGTVWLTSGKIDQVEDISGVSIGVCRHHYMFLDVTNY